MIILLNGCSSAGKSSIIKALQILADRPWLHLGIDTFFQMMPDQYVGYGAKAHEGFHFVTMIEDGEPITRIDNGPFGQAVVQSMPAVVRALVASGHTLILDEVILDDVLLREYVRLLNNEQVYFIGVHCALETLLEREQLRGDRALGLARDQYTKVHQPAQFYDLEVDTTQNSPFACAKEIMAFVESCPTPQSFKSLQIYYEELSGGSKGT